MAFKSFGNKIYGYGHKKATESKYGSKKTVVDGITFDSKKEAKRWIELKQLEQAGQIFNLQRQVKFSLIPAQREPDIIGPRGGRNQGKLIEREAYYIADFTYFENNERLFEMVVEDVKGIRTPEYILKRKLMLLVHGIRIKEV